MNRIFITISFCFLFLSSSVGQTKEEVMSCLEEIFDHSNMEVAYQHNSAFGRSIVLNGFFNKFQARSRNLIRTDSIRMTLCDDDFYDFYQPIKVVPEEMQEQLGIDQNCITDLFINGNENYLRFVLSSYIAEERMIYRWVFDFQKEDEEWVLEVEDITKEPENRKSKQW